MSAATHRLDTAEPLVETPRMSVLLGRSAELARLLEALEQARRGRGRLVLLVGEPGIGKTRLADELTAKVEAPTPVVWGRCWEAGGAPAYWPWIQVLRALLAERDRTRLAQELGPAAADVVALVPEWADASPANRATDATGDARFRLFDAVARLLAKIAEPSGLVVVLDDLHAADLPSLLLAKFVARSLTASKVMLVVTLRDVEARLVPEAGSIVAEIEREGEVVRPRRLLPDEIAAYVRQVAGLEPREDVVGALARTTEGNPLYLAEAVRLANVEGTLQAPTPAGLVRLSEGIGAAIRSRLRHVSAETRAVLEQGAVLGREFDLSVLRAATGEKADVLLDRLAEALTAGIVVDLDVSSPRFRFSHFLVREALYQDLGAARRARLHLAAADGLERLHREAAEDRVVEVAHQLLAAGDAADPQRVVDRARRAGERSLRVFAFEDAVAWLERGLEVVDRELRDHALRAELCLQLAEAHTITGNGTAARKYSLDAAAAARALGSAELLARAALALGAEIVAQTVDSTLVSLLQEAFAALPEEPSALRVRVMARLAAAQQPAADASIPTALARRAIEEARGLDDPRAQAQVLFSARAAYMPLDDLGERKSIDELALTLALETNQKVLALRAYQRLVYDNVESGNLAEARHRADAYQRLAAELRTPRHVFGALLAQAALDGIVGRFAEAREKLDRAGPIAEQTGDPTAEYAHAAAVIGMLRAWTRDEEVLAFIDSFRKRVATMASPPHPVAIAYLELYARIRATPVETLRAMAKETFVDYMSDRAGGQVFFAEAAIRIEDQARGARYYRNLLPWADKFPAFLNVEGCVSQALGGLAELLSRPEDARRHFVDAIEINERVGARPWVAQSAAAFADFLERQGDEADAAQMRELRARARAIAEELEMTGLLTRLGPGPAARPSAPPAVAAPDLAGVLRQEGDVWTVTFGDVVFRLKDSRGLHMLARLIAEPGREVHVLDLSGSTEPESMALGSSDAGPVLDAQARAAYRKRIEELREELSEAEEWNDRERAARCRREIEMIGEQIASGVGIGGRDRKAANAAERARINVQRRLTDAIRKIGEQCPTLGDHLARSIRTGVYCSYLGRV